MWPLGRRLQSAGLAQAVGTRCPAWRICLPAPRRQPSKAKPSSFAASLALSKYAQVSRTKRYGTTTNEEMHVGYNVPPVAPSPLPSSNPRTQHVCRQARSWSCRGRQQQNNPADSFLPESCVTSCLTLGVRGVDTRPHADMSHHTGPHQSTWPVTRAHDTQRPANHHHPTQRRPLTAQGWCACVWRPPITAGRRHMHATGSSAAHSTI